jgi:hypothetical protein
VRLNPSAVSISTTLFTRPKTSVLTRMSRATADVRYFAATSICDSAKISG